MKARDLAQGKWPSVLTQLGMDAGVLDGKHHPCPKDGSGTDRFRFADRNGSGNYFCACSDGTKGGMSLIMCCKGLDYPNAARQVESVVTNAAPTPIIQAPDPRKLLRKIQATVTTAGDAVRAYLANRGLEPTPAIKQARLGYWQDGEKQGEFDAMVCVVSAADGAPLTFHVTYLHDGAKADVECPRKIMPPIAPITGGAIRLMPAAEEMGIAEGIETALSASKLYKIPVWACVNEGLLSAFEPPEGVKTLWVFGDGDRSYVGQHAAYGCAKRLAKRGIECAVHLPKVLGCDFNDVLQGRAA